MRRASIVLLAFAGRDERAVIADEIELDPLGQIVREMRYRALRDIDGNPEFGIWSITVIPDLRTRDERNPEN